MPELRPRPVQLWQQALNEAQPRSTQHTQVKFWTATFPQQPVPVNSAKRNAQRHLQ
jgi:ribosomal protein S7